MTYEGWTNYETWAVRVWIDNDEGLYLWVRDLIRDADNAFQLETMLKELVGEHAPDIEGLYADLLWAAIQAANYYEIAENLIEDWADDEDDAQAS